MKKKLLYGLMIIALWVSVSIVYAFVRDYYRQQEIDAFEMEDETAHNSYKKESYHLIDSMQFHMTQALLKFGFNYTNASIIARDFEKKVTPYFDDFFWAKAKTIYVITDYTYFDAEMTDAIQEEENARHVDAIYYTEGNLNPIKGKFLQVTFHTKSDNPSIIYSKIILGRDNESFQTDKSLPSESFKIGYVKY